MRAVLYRVGTGVRARWRPAVLLVLAIGLAVGICLAALAGARRTDTAVDRFLAYSQGAQGAVGADPALYPRIEALPEVDASARISRLGMMRVDDKGRRVVDEELGAVALSNFDLGRAIVLSGRIPPPDRVDEVAVNASAAQNANIRVGDVLHFRAYSPEQANLLLPGTSVTPAGPVVAPRVVGIVRFPADLSTGEAAPGVTFAGQDTAFFTPAFLRADDSRVASVGGQFLLYRLGAEPNAAARFQADVARLSGGQASVFPGSDDVDAAALARHTTSLEALALLLFGILAGVVTLTLIAQAFARRVYIDADEYPAERAMGMTRRQWVAVAALRAALVVVLGAVLAIALAVLASPWMPIGLARQAEVHRGYSVDVSILVVGAIAIGVVLVAWTALVAYRATRVDAGQQSRRGSSSIAQALGRAGSAPSATVGATMAFDSGRGRRAVPTRIALVSAVIAVSVVVGALTFGTNLSRLADNPDLQGWKWDAAVGNPHSEVATSAKSLESDPSIAQIAVITGAESIPAQIDGRDAALFGIDPIKGADLVPFTAGRAPVRADEIALGARSLRDLHLHIGGQVRVSTGGPPQSMLITGKVLLTPSVVNDSVQFGRGAVVSGAALRSLHADAPANVLLVRFAPDADRSALFARLQSKFPGVVLRVNRPPDIENLRRVDRLPALLAALFALIALLTVGNTLVNSVRRRRRDIAVLRTMGFVRRQVSAAVAWQASLIALVAIVFGLPIGVTVGRLAWNFVTDRLGLPPDAVVPSALLVVVAVVALVAANLIAVGPGILASRTPPASILHGE